MNRLKFRVTWEAAMNLLTFKFCKIISLKTQQTKTYLVIVISSTRSVILSSKRSFHF